MVKKKPKSTSRHSWLELNEKLYMIGSSNFRCLNKIAKLWKWLFKMALCLSFHVNLFFEVLFIASSKV
jgi:hypothetical protein